MPWGTPSKAAKGAKAFKEEAPGGLEEQQDQEDQAADDSQKLQAELDAATSELTKTQEEVAAHKLAAEKLLAEKQARMASSLPTQHSLPHPPLAPPARPPASRTRRVQTGSGLFM
jgi:uncharacterized protein YPO0396